ncbi:MAG: hypothetical protein ACFUZC_16195 [Chthoniobacteraceae bacterium]
MVEYQYLYRKHFLSFVKFAFRILHPDERFYESWHEPFLANLLEFMWTIKEPLPSRKVIFNLPPGCLKTHLCAISLPMWILGRDPRQSVLLVSETPEHARTIQSACLELLESPRYKAIFPRARIKRVSRDIELTYGGVIRHAGIGYTLPHRQSDLVVIDNPESMHNLNPKRYGPLRELGRLLKHPDKGMIVVATRRLGPHDMSDFLYRCGGWGKLSMPAVAIEEKRWEFPPGDNYTQYRGEPLTWRIDWDDLEKRLHELGGEAFAYQYLQGEYVPCNTYGSCLRYNDDGHVVMVAGKPSLTQVAAKYLAGLRVEHEEMVEKIEEIIRTTKVKIPPEISSSV